MKIQCPKCKKIIVVKGIGRKAYPIAFKIVYKALRLNSKGNPDLTNTALRVERETGIKISPAFVLQRLRKEAAKKNMTYDELMAQIMTKGKRRIK